MKLNGARRLNRLLAFLLTAMLLITTCMTPAYAANIWNELTLNILWTDWNGNVQSVPALPVESSADRAYWANIDPAAMNQTLTVEAITPDPSYSFYFEDDFGGRTASFLWTDEMDAMGLGYEYAYTLFFSVNGTQADLPIYLYVSSMPLPEEDVSEPFPVQVPVYYVTEDGTLLDTEYVECWAGETTPVWAASSATQGYSIVGPESVNVTVDQSGHANPVDVTFLYRQVATPTPEPTDVPTPTPVAEVSVPVAYYHVNGETLDFQEIFLTPGTHAIQASSARVNGLVPVSDTTVYITVYPDGSTDLASVVFYYEDAAPAEATIPVYFYHEDGTLLDVQEVTLSEGSHRILPNSSKVAEYKLTGPEYFDVTVYSDGSASVANVQFLYKNKYVAPAEATIPVYFYHEDGTLLDVQEVTLSEGSHRILPNSGKVAEYELTGAEYADVTVYSDGSASVENVQFLYKDKYVAPAEATIPVYFYHEDGTLLDVQEVTLSEGSHRILPNSSKVTDYELTGPEYVDVTVYSDGSASVANVQFFYKDKYVAPVEATITVNYLHIERGLLDSQTVTLPEGTHIVRADSRTVEGLNPVGSTSAEVTVYADGSFHPGTVDFYYEDAYVAPVTAKLTIIYQLADGSVIARDTAELAPGSYTILPDSSKIGNYQLEDGQSHQVLVDENGAISEEVVSFICRQPAVTIAVHYQDDRGRDVAPIQYHTFDADGNYVIKANPDDLAADYEPAPGLHTEVPVTVKNGVASQTDVYFYYQLKQTTPAAAHVTVGYFDTDGKEIAASQSITLEPGKHQLTPDPDHVPAGYELVTDASITVEVYENGTFSPQEVAFYYRKAQAEQQATVHIYYCDDRGKDVATSQVRTFGNGTHIITAEPEDLLPGYELFEGVEAQTTITVRNGVPSQSRVVFYYQKVEAEVTEFTLPVYYYDSDKQMIATTQYVKIAPGNYSIQANPTDLPEGYELISAEKLPVVVNQDGTTDPAEIAFYYRAPEKRATVIVAYVNESGQTILDPFTMELAAGDHTVKADASLVPNGYDPASAEPVRVRVSKEGVASPDQVVFVFERLVYETPIPVGSFVYRYATVNGSSVALRSEPSTARSDTVLKRVKSKTKVYVLQELYNDNNEVWAKVIVNGQEGYMMSEFLDIMTQAESDAYAAGSTPAPTFTPVPEPTQPPTPTPTQIPTATPTYEPTQAPIELISPPPTSTPTLEPLPTETATATPTASPTAEPYTGYALTTRATALRTGISSSDMTIMQSLEANELVSVVNQVADPVTGESWSIVSTLNGQAGFVQDSALRPITDKEAEPYLLYWEVMNKTPEPTELVTATPEPMQLEGYGVVLGDEVPFRQMASEFSRIIDNLEAGTIVYITGQTPADGQYWHSVNYEGYWGYIRTDLVRMLTIAEEEAYLDRVNSTPTPEPVTTNLPFDEQGLSSYGYVDGSTVNWRESPSTGAKKVGELKRYALCLVLGTEYVNGVTWYKVSYNDKTGYLHGDFFKQLTISELESFLGSDEYLQGYANNSSTGNSSMDDVGFTGTGGIVSAEDQWVNKNYDVYASFAPFNPIATVAPIQTTPTLEPLPGTTPEPTSTPTATPTFNPLPDVTYPTTDSGNGGSAVVWVVVIGLLLLAVGGVFALVRYQQKRRRIALRAAQRRAQAARAQQQQQQRPYARTSNQPRTGAYPNQQTTVRRSAQNSGTVDQSTSQYSPYSGTNSYNAGSYQRPVSSEPAQEASSNVDDTTQRAPRVGRRTAYRQAHQQSEQSDENNSFDA